MLAVCTAAVAGFCAQVLLIPVLLDQVFTSRQLALQAVCSPFGKDKKGEIKLAQQWHGLDTFTCTCSSCLSFQAPAALKSGGVLFLASVASRSIISVPG